MLNPPCKQGFFTMAYTSLTYNTITWTPDVYGVSLYWAIKRNSKCFISLLVTNIWLYCTLLVGVVDILLFDGVSFGLGWTTRVGLSAKIWSTSICIKQTKCNKDYY